MILTVQTYCQFEKRNLEIDWIYKADVKFLYTQGCDCIHNSVVCTNCLKESRKIALELLKLRALDVEFDLKKP